nr:hypothetical protein [Henriciella aquimarina]
MEPPDNHTYDFTSHPFIETADRNDAAQLVEGCLPGRLFLDRFAFGVDGREFRLLLHPGRDEAPFHLLDAALAIMFAADEDIMGRRRVPVRPEIRIRRRALQIERVAIFFPGERIPEASAH